MTIERNQIYDFKTEFWTEVGIKKNQWETRRQDLLEWLNNFYDYELLEGRPIKILIKDIYGTYQPLPRKNIMTAAQKHEDYRTFTIAALGTEFKPNSKAKTSREAIGAFGREKYGHDNVEGVSRRYVGPVFDEYGETSGVKHWVWYSTYESLDDKVLERWRAIMSEEHISEQEAANAFYRQEQGEDVSKEKGYFKKARDRFMSEFGDMPILVSDWRLKKGAV